ncbi:MAG: glycosyltransferase family 2 protein [Bacteroidales bacterium]|nr:glycosyltransferase family 2 protein [Bacteroidales bacterium]
MDSVKVSVIIPVINQESHIGGCLDSVMAQTLKEIEIIVVEGGSTDHSPEIICEHMDKDKRIKLLNKAGEGLSLARDAGLKMANGKYVYHLDGDDTLEVDALEKLYNRAEDTAADMVVLNFWIENEYNNTRKASHSIRFVRLTGIDFIKTIYSRENYWMVWSVFHSRALYSNFDIKFDAELFLGEDTLLTTQLAYYSKKIVKLDSEPLLHHFIRKNPEEKKLCFSEKHYFDLNTYPELIRNFLKDKPEYDQLEESVDCLQLQSIIRSFQYHFYDSPCEKSQQALRILKKYPSLKSLPGRKMRRVFHAFSISEHFGRLVSRLFL